MVSKKKKRYTDGEFDLDLSYVNPRIIAMGFPSLGAEKLFRNPMEEVEAFFEAKHPVRNNTCDLVNYHIVTY